jgi:hypothetical protein
VFYGVFIAGELDKQKTRGQEIPFINRILMTDLFVLSKDDLFTHYMFCCKSFDFADMQNISRTRFLN